MSHQFRERFGAVQEVFSLVWIEESAFVKLRLIASILLITAASALTALGPVALKHIVDGFTGKSSETGLSAAALVGLYVLSQWLARSVGEIRGVIYARAERRMSRTLSERLFGHILRLPLRFHLNRQTGAVTQALMNGLQGYQLVLHTLVFSFLPVVTELATVIIVLSQVGKPTFLLLFFAALTCYGIVFTHAARKTITAARTASAAQVESTAAITDGVLNYETVKFFTAEKVMEEKVRGSLIRTEEQWVRFFRQFAVNGLRVATIYAIFLGSSILYAVGEVQAGRITIGTFVLINSYMLQVVRPVEMLGYAVQSLSQGVAYLEKMLELFHEKAEVSSGRPGAALHGLGRLDFEHVAVSYQADHPILTDVSFTVQAGRTLGIVGASGCGKSTIVRLLTRLMEPDGGRILLDGVPISSLSLEELRGAIAVVPQETELFNETIGYNIAFGKPGSVQQEVEHAARLAHLHDFIVSLPDGYDTHVGERGVKLSGGEKQRVAIARAAIKQPRIYAFDEATSSLDSRTEREILENLEEIARHSTAVVIAHRLSTVVHADEIVLVDSGVILERGTHRSLLELNGRYAQLWMLQQGAHVVRVVHRAETCYPSKYD
jgi:ABC-type transport system involved in Fe-S cluster assembly fused permease/ATPase subunit